MKQENFDRAKEIETEIKNREHYGSRLSNILFAQDDYDAKHTPINLLRVEVQFGNNGSFTLNDVDERDIIETAIARNDREIKKLQKEFEKL